MTVFPNLSAEMSRYGFNDKDIALVVGKDPRTVHNWINGRTDIPFKQCIAIRNALFEGMTTDYLFDSEPRVGITASSN